MTDAATKTLTDALAEVRMALLKALSDVPGSGEYMTAADALLTIAEITVLNINSIAQSAAVKSNGQEL